MTKETASQNLLSWFFFKAYENKLKCSVFLNKIEFNI